VQNSLGEYHARIIQLDPPADLAVLKIEDTSYHAFNGLPYGISKTDCELGEDLFTLGYPRPEIVYGKGYLSAETGFQGDTTAFQLTIAANPGNSGTPVLNNDGEVIGILTSSQHNAQGMVFAVRSRNIFRAIDSMKGRQQPSKNRQQSCSSQNPAQLLYQRNGSQNPDQTHRRLYLHRKK
jgi:serine protease Do